LVQAIIAFDLFVSAAAAFPLFAIVTVLTASLATFKRLGR
jgi:hypothetical protein